MAVKPKLALIPSGIKDGKVYSVLPSNGDGDFTFYRDSLATRLNKDGLIETVASNVPRLNYPLIDGVVSGCPSLLLEPERTNLLPYSEDFTQGWNLDGVTVLSNNEISPDGALNADKITENSSNSAHYINTAGNFINTGVTTNKVFSVFVKKDEITRIGIVDFRYSNGLEVEFNLKTKSIGRTFGNLYVSAKIEEFPNDWLRCTVVYDTEALTSMGIALLDDNYNPATKIRDYTYQGDGTSGVYIWGAELKVGNPTSYIPTSGSQTTRSAETCNNSGDANTFNDSEGVLMVEAVGFDSGVSSSIYLGDGGTSNRMQIVFHSSKEIRAFITGVNGGNTTVFNSGISTFDSFHKVVISYSSSAFEFWIDGFKIDFNNSDYSFNSGELNELSFEVLSGVEPFYGNTKQIQYFDTALTDTDLEELTSWTSFNEMAESQLYSIQ